MGTGTFIQTGKSLDSSEKKDKLTVLYPPSGGIKAGVEYEMSVEVWTLFMGYRFKVIGKASSKFAFSGIMHCERLNKELIFQVP